MSVASVHMPVEAANPPALPRARRVERGPGGFMGGLDGLPVVRWGGLEMGATRVRVAGEVGAERAVELDLVDRAVLRRLMSQALRRDEALAAGDRGVKDLVTHRELQKACGMLGASGWTRTLGIVVTRLRARLSGIRALVRIDSETDGPKDRWGYRIRDLGVQRGAADRPVAMDEGGMTSSGGC